MTVVNPAGMKRSFWILWKDSNQFPNFMMHFVLYIVISDTQATPFCKPYSMEVEGYRHNNRFYDVMRG